MGIKIERISAVTLKVASMEASVGFYRDVLGMELTYGGPDGVFSSFRTPEAEYPILNLEQGGPTTDWGRMIFHVADVDSWWSHLKEKGFDPDQPRDASWGERYFHVRDPDGHELSFARPLISSAK
jgi:catechol 2,3-dioxygenase-like lactoylglutathione lyase family enzyme